MLDLLIGVAIDVVMLVVLVSVLKREENPDVGGMVVTALLLAGANAGLLIGLGRTLGTAVLLPMLVVDTGIIYWRCALTWAKSLITVAVLFAVKTGYFLIFSARV